MYVCVCVCVCTILFHIHTRTHTEYGPQEGLAEAHGPPMTPLLQHALVPHESCALSGHHAQNTQTTHTCDVTRVMTTNRDRARKREERWAKAARARSKGLAAAIVNAIVGGHKLTHTDKRYLGYVCDYARRMGFRKRALIRHT